MSKRRQLVEKIIREELAAYNKKILDERKGVGLHKADLPGMGMRGGQVSMPEPEPDRAIPANKKRSTMTSIVDEPDSKPYFVEALAEEAAQSDKDTFGVDTTSSLPTFKARPIPFQTSPCMRAAFTSSFRPSSNPAF